jgi:hypothetical protein
VLVLVAFQAHVSRNRVVVNYVLTRAAGITLSVVGTGRRPVSVTRTSGRAGLNHVTWNRKLVGKRATVGTYRLVVTATANTKTVTSSVLIRLR